MLWIVLFMLIHFDDIHVLGNVKDQFFFFNRKKKFKKIYIKRLRRLKIFLNLWFS